MLSTLLIVNRLLIGLWPRSITHQLVFASVKTLCIAIPNAQEDESFADDLNKKRGIVRSRVALLLRSPEIQPAVSKIRAPRAPPPPSPLHPPPPPPLSPPSQNTRAACAQAAHTMLMVDGMRGAVIGGGDTDNKGWWWRHIPHSGVGR